MAEEEKSMSETTSRSSIGTNSNFYSNSNSNSNSSSSNSNSNRSNGASRLRVMQWNVLADGLAQFGDFVRAGKGIQYEEGVAAELQCFVWTENSLNPAGSNEHATTSTEKSSDTPVSISYSKGLHSHNLRNGLPRSPPAITDKSIHLGPVGPCGASSSVALLSKLKALGDKEIAPKEVLEWSVRAPKLLNKILEAAADIICLQELNHYDDYFLPQMQAHGYAGIFRPKNPSPATKYGCPADGSAVFYKASRFFVEREVEMKVHGVICHLKCLQDDQDLVVAATHLKAKTGTENDAIRLKQIQELLQKLTECTSGGALPCIICGDFNTNPLSEVYKLVHEHSLRLQSVYARQHDAGNNSKRPRIDNGEMGGNGLEEEQKNLTANECETFLSITSGTSIAGGSEAEPPFTTWKFRSTGEKRETIDYIWFSGCPTLTPDRLWRLPTVASIGPDGLPSEAMPSDHLPLFCEFKWKSKETLHKSHDHPVEADLHYLNIPRISSTEVFAAIIRES